MIKYSKVPINNTRCFGTLVVAHFGYQKTLKRLNDLGLFIAGGLSPRQ